MPLLLLGAIVSLIAWVVLAFVAPMGGGYAHGLLIVSGVLFVRWIGLQEPAER